MSPPELAGNELLHRLQSELMAAIAFAEQPPSTEELIRSRNGLGAEAQLGIYAQTVTATWMKALRQTYPAALRWIGEEAFDTLARRYLAAHPSRRGDLERLGEDFPAFVTNSAESEAAELAELCRFEWLINQLRLAPEVEALNKATLESIDIDELVASRLRFVPRAALFESAHPVISRWRAEMEKTEDHGRVLLIFEDSLTIRRLLDIESAFVDIVLAAPSAAAAVEAAQHELPTHNIPVLITFVIQSGAFFAIPAGIPS